MHWRIVPTLAAALLHAQPEEEFLARSGIDVTALHS